MKVFSKQYRNRLQYGTSVLCLALAGLIVADNHNSRARADQFLGLRQTAENLRSAPSGEQADLPNGDVLLIDASACITYQLAILRSLRSNAPSAVKTVAPAIVVHNGNGMDTDERYWAMMLRKVVPMEAEYFYTSESLFEGTQRAPVVSATVTGGILADAHVVVPLALLQIEANS